MFLPFTDGLVVTNHFDQECRELADRHYSRRTVGARLMHYGSIRNPKTKAARTYALLMSLDGGWIGGDKIAEIVGTNCMSTRLSEVRKQLPPHLCIERQVTHTDEGCINEYRIVRAGQLELFDAV